jgi:hypothetical protein
VTQHDQVVREADRYPFAARRPLPSSPSIANSSGTPAIRPDPSTVTSVRAMLSCIGSSMTESGLWCR